MRNLVLKNLIRLHIEYEQVRVNMSTDNLIIFSHTICHLFFDICFDQYGICLSIDPIVSPLRL